MFVPILLLLVALAFPVLCVVGGFWTASYSIGWDAGLNGRRCYALDVEYPNFLERVEIRGYKAALKAKAKT